MSIPGFTSVSNSGGLVSKISDAADKLWVSRLALKINALLSGQMNVVLPVTLTASVTSTTVTDARIGAFSALVLQPLTTNAAAALYGTPYVLPSGQKSGSVVLNHANNTQTDRNFNLVILG